MSGAVTPIIYVIAFIAVVMFVQAFAEVVLTRRDRGQRVNRRLTMLEQGKTRDEVLSALLRTTTSGSGMPANAVLTQFYERVSLYCAQAGIAWSPFRLLGVASAGAAVLWLVVFSLSGASHMGGALTNAIMSLVGAFSLSIVAVWIWVRMQRNRRLKEIAEQLPIALDIINRALRAGHPMNSAVQLASEELRDPLASEFGIIVDETNYGMDFREALASFARRSGSPDVHFFAVSIAIQTETGGNLAEILDGLAHVMRGRMTLGKRVRALSSEGRASAMLLSVLPAGMILVQMLINPVVYSSKFSDPVFWPIVVGITGVYLLGWFMVHRIINFRY